MKRPKQPHPDTARLDKIEANQRGIKGTIVYWVNHDGQMCACWDRSMVPKGTKVYRSLRAMIDAAPAKEIS